jgi:hypothetical protein
MTNYPLNYKYTSVEISASTTRKIYQRTTYDFLNAFGDVGGFNEFLRLFLSFSFTGFAVVTEKSLLTKYLFKYNTDDKSKARIQVPTWLEAKYAFNKIFFCC